MATECQDVAARIIRGVYGQDIDIPSDPVELREMMEAARIASLQIALACISPTDRTVRMVFERVTRPAELLGVRPRRVILDAKSIVQDIGERLVDELATHVHSLGERGSINLLASLHFMGSHVSPSSDSHLRSLRPLGTFYTPVEVADFITEHTLGPIISDRVSRVGNGDLSAIGSLLEFRVLDPACGSGAFLVSALLLVRDVMRQMAQTSVGNDALSSHGGPAEVTQEFQTNLYGVDLDAAALEISAVSLSLVLGKKPSTELVGRTLRQGDALISRHGLSGNDDHSVLINPEDNWLPFEWPKEFPDVLVDGDGFDAVLMNPPYERRKPNFAEFLRERISRAVSDDDEFRAHRERLSHLVSYFRRSPDYCYSNRFTIDTHRLFIERALRLTRENGRLGFVVPTSILGDMAALPLRRHLLYENRLISVVEFPESARLFPGVTQGVSVIVMSRGGSSEIIHVFANVSSVSDLRERTPLRISLGDIEHVTGSSVKIPQADRESWTAAMLMHRHPRLSDLRWAQVLRGELDLTVDREFVTDHNTGIPLVRGSHIGRLRLLHRRKRNEFVLIDEFKRSRRGSERMAHIGRSRIACQQVSNRMQRWRLKFAVVPPTAVLANSCNYIVVESDDHQRLLYLLGVLNSSLLNWRFRITSTNNHVSNREIGDLPIVDPSQGETHRPLVRTIATVVESTLRTGKTEDDRLDALVFALYDIPHETALSVLGSLGADDAEKKRVAALMAELS
ncbi:MAG: Eco57I restriction-modification methylase domain-containing protein [Candidatus Thorarchaeota archaeon]